MPETGSAGARAMLRVSLLAAIATLALAYYTGFGPGPTPSELGTLPWWRPRGWVGRWPSLAWLEALADSDSATLSSVAVIVAALPPLAAFLLGIRLFRGAVARTLLLAVALTLVGFAGFGLLAPLAWRFFGWRWPAAMAASALLTAALLFAPSLLRSALALRPVARGVALAGPFILIYALSTEITGTNPELAANFSPWPVLTLFGLGLVGSILCALHVAAGLGLWLRSGLRGRTGRLAGVPLAAAVAAGIGLVRFRAPTLAVLAAVALGAALYAAVAARRAPASGPLRLLAGAGLALGIFLSDQAATRYRTLAREGAAVEIVLALERYRQHHDVYPDALESLVPKYLERLPRPRMGLIPHRDERFLYSGFGGSFLLEFASVLWEQCAYSPAYVDDEEAETAASEPPADAPPGAADALPGSWTCHASPPELW